MWWAQCRLLCAAAVSRASREAAPSCPDLHLHAHASLALISLRVLVRQVGSGGGVSGVLGAAGAQARSPQPLTVDPLQRVICNELDSQKARCDTLEQTVRAQEVTIKR